MYYSGKYFDTFEMALAQLLSAEHCAPIPFIDCLCLRCFGFRTGGALGSWFQPYVSLPASIAAFADAVKLQVDCKEICSLDQIPNGCERFLLGPASEEITAPEIRSIYYRAGTYFFIQRHSASEWEVYDPHGWLGLTLPQEILDTMIRPYGTFCVWLAGLKQRTQLKPQDILARGLAYHRQISGDERRLLTQACGGYRSGRKSDLSLHYAVLNLLQQMDKAFTLAAACGWDVETQYLKEKQAVFSIGSPPDTLTLQEAILNMWRILDDER